MQNTATPRAAFGYRPVHEGLSLRLEQLRELEIFLPAGSADAAMSKVKEQGAQCDLFTDEPDPACVVLVARGCADQIDELVAFSRGLGLRRLAD